MKVKDLIYQLLAFDNQDEEVKIVYLPRFSGDAAYWPVVATYAGEDGEGRPFIGLEIETRDR